MREIAEDLFIIEDDVLKANVFVLLEKNGYFLIDTGIFMKTKYLIQILEKNKFPIEHALFSHGSPILYNANQKLNELLRL